MKIALAILPFLAAALWRLEWVIWSWRHSPLDKAGPLYLVAAILLGVYLVGDVRRLAPARDRAGFFLVAAALAGFTLSLRLDINVAYHASILLGLAGVVLLFRGWRVFLLSLPVLGLAYLSLPTTTYQVEVASLSLLGARPLDPVLSKALAGILLGLLSVVQLHLDRKRDRPLLNKPAALYLSGVFAALLCLWVLRQPEIRGAAFRPDPGAPRIGSWSGTDLALTPAEEAFFRGYDIRKSVYFEDSGEAVSLIAVTSKEDIYRLHPPEYCLSGSGWALLERGITRAGPGPESLPVTRLRAKRRGLDMLVYYWFSSQRLSTPSHAAFRKEARRTPDASWALFQASTEIASTPDEAETVLQRFLGASVAGE